MTQEEKELLLKDLCARLPYGVIVKDRNGVHELTAGNTEFTDLLYNSKCNIKPYLFPLSSMTDEQWKELRNLIYEYFALDEEFNEGICYKTYGDILVWLDEKPINECYFIFDYFNKNHFDYRGLIPMGLAIDATNKNIY